MREIYEKYSSYILTYSTAIIIVKNFKPFNKGLYKSGTRDKKKCWSYILGYIWTTIVLLLLKLLNS